MVNTKNGSIQEERIYSDLQRKRKEIDQREGKRENLVKEREEHRERERRK